MGHIPRIFACMKSKNDAIPKSCVHVALVLADSTVSSLLVLCSSMCLVWCACVLSFRAVCTVVQKCSVVCVCVFVRTHVCGAESISLVISQVGFVEQETLFMLLQSTQMCNGDLVTWESSPPSSNINGDLESEYPTTLSLLCDHPPYLRKTQVPKWCIYL